MSEKRGRGLDEQYNNSYSKTMKICDNTFDVSFSPRSTVSIQIHGEVNSSERS